MAARETGEASDNDRAYDTSKWFRFEREAEFDDKLTFVECKS